MVVILDIAEIQIIAVELGYSTAVSLQGAEWVLININIFKKSEIIFLL
jgi:hypothetical protein